MSKKSKLILATALFGAALFGASCGGGGGGTASTPPPPPPPPPPPGPTVEGRVLALLNLGTVSAGTSRPVSICELRSNGKAVCGTDLNPSEDANLEYVHEFPNGNVVLQAGGVLYFFNGSQVIKLDKFRPLGASSTTPETPEPGGITLPSSPIYYATPNFVIVVDNTSSTKTLVVITSSGRVIKDTGTATYTVNASCEAVTRSSGAAFKLNTDGTSTSTTILTLRASAGGKFLVSLGPATSTTIYLSDSNCELVNPVIIGILSNVQDAKMVKVGNDFYIAVRYVDAGTHRLNYYTVSGTRVTNLQTGLALRAGNSNLYDIDGRGYLYYNNDTNKMRGVSPAGAALTEISIGSGNVEGILAFNDRVLARTSTGVQLHDVFINNAGDLASTATPPGANLTALQRCTDTDTKDIDGRGTAVVRCVWDSGSEERLVVLVHNGGGVYAFRDTRINPTSDSGTAINDQNIRFGANAVLVVTRPQPSSTLRPIHLCTITTTPTLNASCSPTDIPNPAPSGNLPIRDTTRIYPSTDLLKFNGDNVFYRSGTSVKLRNLFSTTAPSLPVTVSSASGGNASFDLTRFAFSFQPATAPSGCNTQIVYLPSANGPEKRYTLSTANTCVTRILKVY